MIVECEHCTGELDVDMVCKESDCQSDMKVHWEMTNPEKLTRVCVERGYQYMVPPRSWRIDPACELEQALRSIL